MYEVELKVRADHDAVRERLEELGATHRGAVTQVDTYYDAPHRDFAETDEALRLRTEERSRDRIDGDGVRQGDATTGEGTSTEAATTCLTYKGPLLEDASKTREEIEIAVSDADAVDGIVRNLGFAPAATVRKDRDRYELDGYRVVLDDVATVGQFVEVEADTEDETDIEPVRDGAREILERLSLDPDEQIRTSYLGLYFEDE